VRLLIVDHFFGQDIDALRHAAAEHELRVVSPDLLGAVARKMFPASVFSDSLGETYARPEYALARQRYEARASSILQSLYCAYPFDALIIPSDTIVYLRACIPAAHQMGIPVIVLNKETTISPHTLTAEARVIGEFLPFISDRLLVCSENNRRFWLNAGADARRLFVTGQPRFDLYRQPSRWKTLECLGVPVKEGLPTLLFFSYDVGAYSPEGPSAPVWTQLLTETEKVLVDLARAGHFNLLVKPHPQQQRIRETQERLSSLAGPAWGKLVQWLPGGLDTRQLIVNAQTVVGFQTTAMFEAMAAGKRVVYTFWTDATARLGDAVVPFHEMGDALLVARSQRELETHVLSDPGSLLTEARTRSRSLEIEKQLGPVDGHASERCIELIEECVADHATQVEAPALSLRRRLALEAPARCRRALSSAQLDSVSWRLVDWLWPVASPTWMAVRWFLGKRGPALSRHSVIERRRAAEERVVACRADLGRFA